MKQVNRISHYIHQKYCGLSMVRASLAFVTYEPASIRSKVIIALEIIGGVLDSG